MTNDQFWEELKRRVRALVLEVLESAGVYNAQLTEDGRIADIRGEFADVYLNGSDIPATNIPIATTQPLAIDDEVVVFCRNRYDKVVLYKKVISEPS